MSDFSRRSFLRVSTVACSSAVFVHSLKYPPEMGAMLPLSQMTEEVDIPPIAYETRVKKVQAEMARQKMDALFIASLTGWSAGWDTRYLGRHWPGIVFVPADGKPTLIAHSSQAPRPSIADTWITDIRWGAGWSQLCDICADRLKEARLPKGRIGVGGDVGWGLQARLQAALPGARFEDGNEIHDQVRLVKDEHEIRMMRRAGEIADQEIRVAFLTVRPGRFIWEVASETQQAALARGADMIDSRDLLGYSSQTFPRVLGGTTKSSRIVSGEAFCFEPIPFYGHYNVETPVTFAVGKVSQEQKDAAELSFESFQAAVAQLKPGVPVSNAWKAGKAVVERKGFTDNTNGTGHFIGIGNIERPAIEKEPGVVLLPGMTVAIHGNLVVPGKARGLVGCVFLITEKGCEAFTDITLKPMFQV
jgi:Xaa-Pro aminopeptidase